MIANHFATFPRLLVARPSRRSLLHALAGSGLATLVGGPRGVSHVDAKKKPGKKRNKHSKKRGHPSRDPVTIADATCQLPWWGNLAGPRRFAQTFRSRHSGQLTRASIGLTYNGEGAAFDLAIRELDPEGKPGYVLASTAISNVPATNLGELPIDGGPTRTITGDFTSPARVVAGQMYALTLTQTERGTGWDELRGPLNMQATSDNPCPDGMLFTDRLADGAFYPQEGWDLAFSTEVTV
jgi:hypothetical protein